MILDEVDGILQELPVHAWCCCGDGRRVDERLRSDEFGECGLVVGVHCGNKRGLRVVLHGFEWNCGGGGRGCRCSSGGKGVSVWTCLLA